MLLLKKEISAFDFSEVLKDHVDLLCFSLYVRMGGSSGGKVCKLPSSGKSQVAMVVLRYTSVDTPAP